MKKPLLAIVGPTAVGKSALAIRLAAHLGGEIVSADSRQVYRHMNIGTAKPSLQDRATVPHHLIDVVDPDEPYSLALFLEQATAAVSEIHTRGRLPILVGGTGQYVWALLEGWQVPRVEPDQRLRQRLEERARFGGAEALHVELAGLDLEAARRIDARNVRRVVRALEVRLSAPLGGPPSRTRVPIASEALIIGLTIDREALYRQIDDRVNGMIGTGWIEEVRGLISMGYRAGLPSMSGVGYRELTQHIEDRLQFAEAVQRTKYRTHRLARQQYGWFRLNDDRILWFDGDDGFDAPEKAALDWFQAP